MPLNDVLFNCRNNSVRELGLFTETANAVNRLLLSHLSISQVTDPTGATLGVEGQDDSTDVEYDLDEGHRNDPVDVMFHFELSDDDDEDGGNESGGSVSSLRFTRGAVRDDGEDGARTPVGSSGGDSGDENEKEEEEEEGGEMPSEVVATSSFKHHHHHHHFRLREAQLSGDSGFTSCDTLSPSVSVIQVVAGEKNTVLNNDDNTADTSVVAQTHVFF